MTPTPKLKKKTIYVDVDEEITGVIDKVRSSDEQIIALVLPKRISTFLSAVNIKLLKRAADQSNKRVVLITSNQSVLPLAGLAGVHVAHNLNSKPYVPPSPAAETEENTTPAEDNPIEIEPSKPKDQEVESIEVDAPSSEPAVKSKKSKQKTGAVAATEVVGPQVKASKKPKIKVPNFNRFRLGLVILAGVIVFGSAFAYWAFAIAPEAVVRIKGETKASSLSFVAKANTGATALNLETSEVPSKIRELKKTESEKVPATGQKDNGNKASGTITLKNCSKSDGSVNIPAGTGVSSGELTFITQAAVSLDPSEFTGGGTCKSDTAEVAVMAQTAGDKYNVDSRSYSVAGFSGVTATGSTMTGGTSQIVKIVAAADIEAAKSKLTSKQVGATEELKAGLDAEGYIPLADTFNSTTGNFVPTPAVGSEAAEVIVSVETKYTMVGFKKSDLQELIKSQAEKQGGIDLSKQVILDDGLSNAGYQLGAVAGGVTDVTIKTNVIAGPEIKQDEIKTEVAGKKRGLAEQSIATRPGVKQVTIETKPFWSYKIPTKQTKITVIVEESDGSQVKP